MTKKKVGIVTLHKVLNFGSVLQAYCTCEAVRRFGFEPEIINYMEPRYTVKGALRGIKSESLSREGNGIRGWARYSLKAISYLNQYRNFESFVNAHLPLSRNRYEGVDEIFLNPPDADIYLTGSDQIWNSDYNQGVDKAHFLDFAPIGKKRVAYAASFGKDSLRSEEISETRELLKKYSKIGVRESSGVDIVKGLGIENVHHVLDPTLLLSKQEWFDLFKPKRPRPEPYVLIYSVERSIDSTVYNVARNIADTLGLKLVFFSQAAKLRSMQGCDEQHAFSKVQDFVDNFYYADYVVASSFHGTAFAVNFNRPFVSVLPPKFGARPRSLLGVVDLSDRIVEGPLQVDRAIEAIDYTKVNFILGREREKSLAFLRDALCEK